MSSFSIEQPHQVTTRRSLQALKWATIVLGASWIIGFAILLVAHWVTDDAKATAANACPLCPDQPLVVAGVVAFGIIWVLAMVAAGIMRFALLGKDGPALPRFATMLFLVGLVLLRVYGLGLIALIPGLLMLASSTEEVPWLSLSSMALIVAGAAGLIPLLMFISEKPGEPWTSLLYLPPVLFGLGWIRLGTDAARASR